MTDKLIARNARASDKDNLWIPPREATLDRTLQSIAIDDTKEERKRTSFFAEIIDDSSELPRVAVKPL